MYDIILFTDCTNNITSIPAIGAYKCAHALRKSGFSCLVINHLSEYSLQELDTLLKIVAGPGTIMVGFSTTFMANVNVRREPGKPTPPYTAIDGNTLFPQGKEFECAVIDLLKTYSPRVKVVMGGAKASPTAKTKTLITCVWDTVKSA